MDGLANNFLTEIIGNGGNHVNLLPKQRNQGINPWGGGTSQSVLDRIKDLENKYESLAQALTGKLDASKVTGATTVTEIGYAADARQLNPAVAGSLAGKVKNTEEMVKGLHSVFEKYYSGNSVSEFIENLVNDIYENRESGMYMICGGWSGHDAAITYAGKFSSYVSAIVSFRESLYFARRNGDFLTVNSSSAVDIFHKEY